MSVYSISQITKYNNCLNFLSFRLYVLGPLGWDEKMGTHREQRGIYYLEEIFPTSFIVGSSNTPLKWHQFGHPSL